MAAACATLTTSAFAGECPADKRGVDLIPPGPSAMTGVADETIGAFDLSERYNIQGRLLRMRRITVAPGGIIAWHGHRERPGMLAILSGEITEYRSTCGAPIVHRAGEGVAENGPFFHWWRNEGAEPAVILSADLPPAPAAR